MRLFVFSGSFTDSIRHNYNNGNTSSGDTLTTVLSRPTPCKMSDFVCSAPNPVDISSMSEKDGESQDCAKQKVLTPWKKKKWNGKTKAKVYT